MNTKVFLGSMAVFLSIATIVSPKIVKSTLPKAYLAQRQSIEYTEYVNANGEIVSADSVEITTDMPIIIKDVLIENGDSVSYGDVLVTIDREKTAKSMMELNEYASIASLGAGTTITDYQSIINLIPETIKSDYNGTVSSVSAKSGHIVNTNGTILTLSGTQPLSIQGFISENRISKVKVGQQVIISGNAFGDKTYEGFVESIADSATKEYNGASHETVVAVKITINSPDDLVKSGYSTNLKICVSDTREISIIPYEAVYSDDSKSYVYIFEEGCAAKKQITTGAETPHGIEVLSGIKENDTVIYSDIELNDGDYVALEITN